MPKSILSQYPELNEVQFADEAKAEDCIHYQ